MTDSENTTCLQKRNKIIGLSNALALLTKHHDPVIIINVQG